MYLSRAHLSGAARSEDRRRVAGALREGRQKANEGTPTPENLQNPISTFAMG